MHEVVAPAADLLADCRRILVFTGAGISTESGIPDFRGPRGIWRKADPEDYNYRRYLTDSAFRQESWRRRFESPFRSAKPNSAHEAVTRLWHSGLLIGCVTQNIDGLHEAAGLPQDALAELHGNGGRIECVACHDQPAFAHIEERWRNGEADPVCRSCGGVLKTAVVYFGEALPVGDIERATHWAADADAAIAVGTTLSVYPAAFVPLDVAGRGDPFIIINEGPTEHDGAATVRLEGKAGSLLPALVAALSQIT